LITPSSSDTPDPVFDATEGSLNGVGGLMDGFSFFQPPIEAGKKVAGETLKVGPAPGVSSGVKHRKEV